MDSIRQAVELARARQTKPAQAGGGLVDLSVDSHPSSPAGETRLNAAHLEASRIVAHLPSAEPGRYYDMLRTQVLQEMDKKSWQFLAITSPTPGCGKTVTSCNLAISISRLPERTVLLVDLDMRKPMVSQYLGLAKSGGVLSVLEGRSTLASEIVRARIGPSAIFVLPGSACPSESSEWMSSQVMGGLLQAIKREFRSTIVIFDLPPILLGDDVISILPRMDAALLVASVGSTSVADIKECQRHLQRTPIARLIVNKVTEPVGSPYGYY